MRRLFLILFFVGWFGATLVQAQSRVGEGGKAPVVALKTNGLYWATTTPNLGIEFRLAPKWTLEAEVGLNPFDGKNDDGSFDQSIKHFRLHPEVRYWFCERELLRAFLGAACPLSDLQHLRYRLAGDRERASPGLGHGCRRELRLRLGRGQALEHRGLDRRGLFVPGVGQVSLRQLRDKDRDGQEALFRPYPGGRERGLFILKVGGKS